ncbi:MAG: hypothetical protein M0D55_10835 [Elusimicrobiota bacterium]|nr:MAG: hypothetical protein M0D55_10835 [Elusimicrobiota bacterium]
MDKRFPLVALLVSAALPASADFCAYNAREESKFRDLSGPECRRESNNFVFNHSSPAYSRHMSKDGSTYVTNQYPGMMGDEQKCINSAKGARILDEKKETYLLAWAVSGTRVFRFKGSCYALKDKLLPAIKEKQKGAEATDDVVEEALKSIGAEEIWMRTFIGRLMEVGEGGYKPLD